MPASLAQGFPPRDTIETTNYAKSKAKKNTPEKKKRKEFWVSDRNHSISPKTPVESMPRCKREKEMGARD